MKKFILLAGMSVFAIIAGAQTIVNLKPNSWDIDEAGNKNYNLQGSQKVSAGEWKAGDEISVEFTGVSDVAISGLSIILVDQSSEANYWKVLCTAEELSDVVADEEFGYAGKITLSADVVSAKAVNLVFSTPGTAEKVTGEATLTFSAFVVEKPGEVVSPTESISLSALGAGGSSSYNAETQTITYEEAWGGRGWWLDDVDLSDYASVTVKFEAAPFNGKLVVQRKNETSMEKDFAAGATSVTCPLSGEIDHIMQIYIQNAEIGDLVLTEAFYTKKGFEEGGEEGGEQGGGETVEPVFTVEVPTLTFKAEYKGEEISGYTATIDLNVEDLMLKKDDIVTLVFDGSFNADVKGISPAIVDKWSEKNYWHELSGWDWVQLDAKANDKVNLTANIKITEDAETNVIIACIPVQGGNGEEEIKFTKTGDPTAVKAVSTNSFSVVNGIVTSKGEITVYNIAGKPVASAQKSLSTKNLQSGVYFIVAPEGTIKFVKK